MKERNSKNLDNPENIFDGAFMDKRLWFLLYLQALEDTTFDVRMWLFLYKEQIWKILSHTPDIAFIAGKFLKEASISGYRETKNALIRSSYSLDFAIFWKVSDSVFEKLWFPEREKNKEEKCFPYKSDEYFSHIEGKDTVSLHYNYCDIFVKTQSFQGRKLVFEEILVKRIPEFHVMWWLEYMTKHDSVLRMVFQESTLYMSEFLMKISNYCYNIYEVKLYFDILYQNTGLDSQDIESHIPEVERIIRKMRKNSQPLTRSQYQQISKTISLLKIQGFPINYETITHNLGLYTFIPSVFSSTHWENSISINLVKGFASSQRPVNLKGLSQHFDLMKAILWDGETLDWVRKEKTKLKIRWNTLVKKSNIDMVLSRIKRLQVEFWEKKMEIFLRYTRYLNPHTIGELDIDTHKEYMKNYFLVDKILKDIESDLHITDGKVEKKPSSRVMNFVLGRGKSKSIAPFATQAWIFVSRVPLMWKFFLFIPFTKIIPLLFIAKTTFVFVFYRLIDLTLYFTKMIPIFERFRRFSQIQGNHTLSSSPELQDLLIEEIPTLKEINRDVGLIRKIKKLRILQKRREQAKKSLNENEIVLWEELRQEIGLLEWEIEILLWEIDQQELQESIWDFKLKYLDILDGIAQNSNISFLE